MSSPPRARPVVRILRACDNACVFCAQAGLADDGPASDAHVTRALEALRAQGHTAVTFTGGEPLLHPALVAYVARARTLGFQAVGIQTNARGLAGHARALHDAGLTDVHVSVHGANAELHDHHTGVTGSFASVAAGVDAVSAVALTVIVSTVLTRSNFRALDAMPDWLVGHRAAAWGVVVPRASGRAEEAFDRVMPRLALALPHALRAIDLATKRGVVSVVIGAPRCVLGPFAAQSLRGEPRAFAPQCVPCPARSVCAGLDALYLARFAGDEISPRAGLSTVEPALPAIVSCFVGAGDLAPQRTAPDAPARRGLPIAP